MLTYEWGCAGVVIQNKASSFMIQRFGIQNRLQNRLVRVLKECGLHIGHSIQLYSRNPVNRFFGRNNNAVQRVRICFLRSIRCPLLGVDAVFVGSIVDPAHGIDVTVGIPVLLKILLGVIPGNVGAGGKADRKLAVAVGVDVLGMVALEDVCAGSLPAAGGQRQAEGAGVAVRDPRKLCAIPLGVLEGGVSTGTLHKAADAPLELGRAVLGGVHHLGDFAVAGRFCRFCRRNRYALGSGQSVVHLAGKLCAALAVPGDEGVRVGNQGFPVSGAVPVKVRSAGSDLRADGSKNAAALKTEDAAEKLGVRYAIDEDFEKAIDRLDENSTKRYAIRVGNTSEVLKSIGVKDRDIFWQAGKLRKILNKHSAANHNSATGQGSIMTKEILKQVPQVLENPIIVLHSDTSRNADYASRIFMYGDVKMPLENRSMFHWNCCQQIEIVWRWKISLY